MRSGVAVKVQASLATIPEREHLLGRAVASLAPQVDVVRVYLNGHSQVPPEIQWHNNVQWESSQDHGDLGDAGKFFWCEEADGIQLLCDDDIIYQRGYAERMAAAMQRSGGKAVVGLHGVTLKEPMLSYYHDRTCIHFASKNLADRGVHLLGTGCLAYDPRTVSVKRSDFEIPNMADIWFGLICQRQRVPMVAAAHDWNWVGPLRTRSSIYDKFLHDDSVQTAAVRRVWPWKVFTVST